jgi:insertion element IS1 protein InsB
MWSYVSKKNSPVGSDGRVLPWVEDGVTGEIIAFVFGRRTHQTFRHLLQLLEEAKIEVIRWITDSWCGAARADRF